MTELVWRYRETLRIAMLLHLSRNPWLVSASANWPRAVLQCLFFTMLGRVAGGEAGQRHAFVGSVAVIVTLFTMVAVADVPMTDKVAATFHRLRLGRVPVPALFAVRAMPLVLDSAVTVTLCLLIVGPLTGLGRLSLQVAVYWPILLLVSLTTLAAGLAVASPAVGHPGASVLVGNAMSYITIIASGALLPTGRLPWLDAVSEVLPVRHGLAALRAALDGRSWERELLLEVVVGVGWAVVAWWAYHHQAVQARRTGADDFA